MRIAFRVDVAAWQAAAEEAGVDLLTAPPSKKIDEKPKDEVRAACCAECGGAQLIRLPNLLTLT